MAPWGYQVAGFLCPHQPLAAPTNFPAFVNRLHAAGLGWLLDWVPGHFPKDRPWPGLLDWLPSLFEHADPRIGCLSTRNGHLDFFNLTAASRSATFLVGPIDYWFEEFHYRWASRVDASASIALIGDYLQGPMASWLANDEGGRENLEAVTFPARQAKPVLFQPLPRELLSIRRRIHHLADGDQPTHCAALGST